jgi:hypothetical protein
MVLVALWVTIRGKSFDNPAQELSRRLSSIFLPNENGERPCHGEIEEYLADPHWRDLVLFHEYFHGETGGGLGASHQTGWTALAVRLLENAVENRIESNTRRKLTAATHPAYAPRLAQNVSHVQAAQRLRFEVFASIQRRHKAVRGAQNLPESQPTRRIP